MTTGRILVVHPKDNLLKILAEDLLNRGSSLGVHTVILPNRRSGLFLKYYLSKGLDGPHLLPQIFSLDDWVTQLFLGENSTPQWLIDDFDASWMVFKAYEEVEEGGVHGARPSWDRFFPWARYILDCFHEFDMELASPQNVLLTSEDRSEISANILSVISDLYQEFKKKVSDSGGITLPMVYRRVAEEPGRYLSNDQSNTTVAGFYALTRCEDALFSYLFNRGATFYWHAPIESLPEMYVRWKEKWNVEPREVVPPEKAPGPTNYFFFEAHDLHSQLNELKGRISLLSPDRSPDRCCIVPLMPTSLIPLLYHLPDIPSNLTMGYPLRLTAPYGFLELVFLLLEQSQGNSFRHKELIEILLHPYSRLDPVLVDEIKRYGAPYIDLETLKDMAKGCNCLVGLHDLFENVVHPISRVKCPYDLGVAVEIAVSFVRYGLGAAYQEGGNKKRGDAISKIDTMALSYLEVEIGEILKNSLFSREEMEKGALYKFFREITEKYRIPFEGEPLYGTQIMGLLETRLINFKDVFIIDANDSVIPGTEEVNPILPRGLRRALGLPEREREEVIQRYHFERLVESARNVHIFWREQQALTSASEELEGKSVKSRFVESILWRLEKQGIDLENSPQMKRSDLALALDKMGKGEGIKKEEAHLDRLKKKFLNLSPTSIETYLSCPKKFFYRYILGLKEEKAIEEIDYGDIGTSVHNALERYYGRLIAKNDVVKQEELSVDELLELFLDELKKRPSYVHLSEERRYLLKKSAYYRLKKYCEHQPSATRVLVLEKEIFMEFPLRDSRNSVKFYGRIDRLDQRDGINIVLDYKTGSVDFVQGDKLVEVASIGSKRAFDEDYLKELYSYFKHIQLLLYTYMLCCTGLEGEMINWDNTTCAYIDLRKEGKEIFLIDQSKLEDRGFGLWLKEEFPNCLRDILDHMLFSPFWYPSQDARICKYCEFKAGCLDCRS